MEVTIFFVIKVRRNPKGCMQVEVKPEEEKKTSSTPAYFNFLEIWNPEFLVSWRQLIYAQVHIFACFIILKFHGRWQSQNPPR